MFVVRIGLARNVFTHRLMRSHAGNQNHTLSDDP